MNAYALDVFRASWAESGGDLAAAVEAVFVAGAQTAGRPTRDRIAAEEAIRIVCRDLGFDLGEIKGHDRSRRISARRAVVWDALRARGFSYPLIGAATGDRDHTTVLAGIKRLKTTARRSNP